MTLSTRVSIQWPPDPATETSHTMVFTSPQNHFVDIRIHKDKYPVKTTKFIPPIEDVFDWCLAGVEIPIAGTSKIRFESSIDSKAICRSIKLNIPIEECKSDPDIGDFSAIEASEDRKEVGIMVNPDTGIKQDYVEIWRSVDPLKHSPKEEVRESSVYENSITFVLVVSSKDFEGKLIRLGNWIQGLLYKRNDTIAPIHVIRAFHNPDSLTWDHLIEFGNTELFPINFHGNLNDLVPINENVIWKCIEK